MHSDELLKPMQPSPRSKELGYEGKSQNRAVLVTCKPFFNFSTPSRPT